MADTSFITLLEAVDKRARITSTGGEIVTTFYIEPASAVPAIISRLLGYVVGDGPAGYNGTSVAYDRHLPAADYDFPFYYCVEAHITPFDRRSVSSSPALLLRQFGGDPVEPSDIDAALAKPIIFDGPQAVNADGTYTEKSPNMCGAYVEATYRPLLSIYDGAATGTGATPQNCFDYIDPQFYPCSRSLQGPPGNLYARYLPSAFAHGPLAPFNYAVAESANLAVETWTEFTIRRVMCPSIPWNTIRQLQNRINGLKAWTPANMTIPGLEIPDPKNSANLIYNTFPIGTLRFDSAEPIMRVVPKSFVNDPNEFDIASDGLAIIDQGYWWDVLYKFSWRNTWDYWITPSKDSVTGTVNNGPGWITWNQVFCGPFGNLGKYSPVGWYDVRYDDRTVMLSTGGRPRYLYAEDTLLTINKNGLPAGAGHPFDALFLMNAT